MFVADDLYAIAAKANRELDAVHDYFIHSLLIWEAFQRSVSEGKQLVAENPATESRLDQDGLVRLAPHYVRVYLAAFTFRQFVSIFETFLFEFLHKLLTHNPWQFSQRQLDFGTVLKAATRQEVISIVVLGQLNELKYAQLREWFVAINKALKLDCPTPDEIERLAEMKATRDIIEHNAGVVNETYLRKAGKMARYQPSDHVEIDDDYHLGCWQLVKKVVTEVTESACGKLPQVALS